MPEDRFQTRRPCELAPRVGASRFVGDPIDIVTGAVVDQETDFRLPGAAVPLSWVRRYDSRHSGADRGLGFGFRHELDRQLFFDLDGITYVDSEWNATSFVHRARDGEQAFCQTRTLERVGPQRYRLHEPDGRSFEFVFASAAAPAQLVGVIERQARLELRYEKEQLVVVRLGALGALQLTWDSGRIARVALLEREQERETELVAYRYDARGRLVEVRNAYKDCLRYTYDDATQLVRKVDRRGYAFVFEYDGQGRCVASRGEDGAEAVRLEYRPSEHSTLVTRHDGGLWQYQYTAGGAVTQILDPYGGAQAYVLDASERVREEIDPLGNSTRIEYDARLIARAKLDPLGHRRLLSEQSSAPHPLSHAVARSPLEWEHGDSVTAPERLPGADDPLWELPPEMRVLTRRSAPGQADAPRMLRNVQGLPLREVLGNGKTRR